MRMKGQGPLMQARFIENHQVFAKKEHGYFSSRMVYFETYMDNKNMHKEIEVGFKHTNLFIVVSTDRRGVCFGLVWFDLV